MIKIEEIPEKHATKSVFKCLITWEGFASFSGPKNLKYYIHLLKITFSYNVKWHLTVKRVFPASRLDLATIQPLQIRRWNLKRRQAIIKHFKMTHVLFSLHLKFINMKTARIIVNITDLENTRGNCAYKFIDNLYTYNWYIYKFSQLP